MSSTPPANVPESGSPANDFVTAKEIDRQNNAFKALVIAERHRNQNNAETDLRFRRLRRKTA